MEFLTIENTDYYDLAEGNKFFLIEKFYEIDFKKKSHSLLRGRKYFFLSEIDGFSPEYGAKEIARLLNGETWSSVRNEFK